MSKSKRRIIFYQNHYLDFFNRQPDRVKDKIDYVLVLVTIADRIPKKFFRHITGYEGLYEIRIELEGNIYRIFCCFDQGNLVVLFNGFQKKTQKTPRKEIEKAGQIMKAYFEEKKKQRKS